ncbi:hypothetical protein [Desulfotomaculum sp. 1211_IL3151]|uniref:hypothetical protein n=1 Tax=Desulfotomaculum sp. 1211_IL3151 TaxID=3084055 RepID=UPI002FD8F2C0
MDNKTIISNLRDHAGRIMGYSRCIAQKTKDEEILLLLAHIITEAEDLLDVADEVKDKLTE